MFFFKSKNNNKNIIKKINGKQIKYVTRRIDNGEGVRDTIVGKTGRIAIFDGNVKVICGTEDVFCCNEKECECNFLLSGNGITVRGNNSVTDSNDFIIVYF